MVIKTTTKHQASLPKKDTELKANKQLMELNGIYNDCSAFLLCVPPPYHPTHFFYYFLEPDLMTH